MNENDAPDGYMAKKTNAHEGCAKCDLLANDKLCFRPETRCTTLGRADGIDVYFVLREDLSDTEANTPISGLPPEQVIDGNPL